MCLSQTISSFSVNTFPGKLEIPSHPGLWPCVSHCDIFILSLGFVSSPFTSPVSPKGAGAWTPSHPSQHLPARPRKPWVSTTFLLPLGLCTFIYGHSWGVFNGFWGHHARFCSHYCSLSHAQPSSRAHHVSRCWCRGAHPRLCPRWDNPGCHQLQVEPPVH